MKKWECGIPGKASTLWDGGLFKLDLIFPEGKCAQTDGIFYIFIGFYMSIMLT